MFLHDGPTFIEDEDGVIGSCSCGWETSIHESKRKAEREFDEEHYYAGIELQLDAPSTVFRNVQMCWFCGNTGHSKDNCSRRPLLRI
jgi:hypothetical protein